MYPLNSVTWVIFVIVSFSDITVRKVDSSARWAMYQDLSARYQSVIEEFAQMTNEVNGNINRLANETYTSLNHRVSGKLKEKFSKYNVWIDALLRNVSSFFSEDCPTRCFRPVESILDDIYHEISRSTQEIEPIVKDIDDCIEDLGSCDFNPDFLRRMINDLENRWSQYKKHDLIAKWEDVERCYEKLASTIETKLLNSTVPKSCGTINTYQGFLEKLSLWPIKLSIFAGNDGHWFSFNDRDSPRWSKRSNDTKLKIKKFLKNLGDSIFLHADGYLIPHVNTTINTRIADITKEIQILTKVQIVHTANLECYQRAVKTLLSEVDSYYRTRMEQICFSQLLDFKNKLLNILDCDLDNMDLKMSLVRRCRDSQEVCQGVMLKLKQLRIVFYLWSFYDLPNLLAHGTRCYSTTSTVIYKNLENSIGDLVECHGLHLTQGLLRHLPVNSKTFEMTIKSEACHNQTKNSSEYSGIYHFL